MGEGILVEKIVLTWITIVIESHMGDGYLS